LTIDSRDLSNMGYAKGIHLHGATDPSHDASALLNSGGWAIARGLREAPMPRFYFHVYDEAVARDDEGLELADAEAARQTALAGARAMICDEVKAGCLKLHHRIEVEDAGGAPVLAISFGEAFRIEP
jgi:hypothetical protein